MKQTGVRQRVGAIILIGVLVACASPAAAGASVSVSALEDSTTLTQQTTPVNNSSVQHERPDNVSESGDTQQVSQWLESRLAGQLQDSAIEISEGEYDRARDIVGDDYNSRLEQYVDVAGETEGTTDDETAETFNETRNEQEEYADRVQSYEETYEDYQQARENGNTSAAREYARELENQSRRITALNESLTRNYEAIENQTGADTSEAREAISNRSQEVESQQATVREQTFIETVLDIEANGTAVAFTEPLGLTGHLRTTNGTNITNQTVRIQVFERTYETTTDADGAFQVSYRPVALPADATAVTVRYLPNSSSPYLGNETVIPVNATQTSPSLDVRLSPAEASYGATVTTDVVATVDGRPVPGLPIRSIVGGMVATGQTDERGQLSLSGRVPASLATGEQEVAVTHNRQGLAVGPVSTATPLTVTGTATNLTVTANATADRVVVYGRLTTADGEVVSQQPVTVTLGETVRSTTTNQTGWYRLSVANVTAGDVNQSAVPVVVRFDGSGTNLESTRTETIVTVPQTGEDGGVESGSPSVVLLISAIVGVGAVVAALLWFRRDSAADESGPVTPTRATETPTDDSESPTTLWLDRAQTALDEGDIEQATIAAYASVRERVSQRARFPQSLTHREFLAACESQDADIDRTALSVVADAYEQATFAPTLDSSMATDAVEAASTLVSRSESSSEQL